MIAEEKGRITIHVPVSDGQEGPKNRMFATVSGGRLRDGVTQRRYEYEYE